MSQDLLAEFRAEALQQLISLEQLIVDLEEGPCFEQTLQSIFHTIHSLKGAAGLFDFQNIVKVTHLFEDILISLEHKSLKPDLSLINILIQARDVLLIYLEDSSFGDRLDSSEICGKLDPFVNLPLAQEIALTQPTLRECFYSAKLNWEKIQKLEEEGEFPDGFFRYLENFCSYTIIESFDNFVSLDFETLISEDFFQEIFADTIVFCKFNYMKEVSSALEEFYQEKSYFPIAQETVKVDRIQVKLKRLDELLKHSSEVVLGCNQIMNNFPELQKSPIYFSYPLKVMSLHEAIMKVRLQPIGTLLNRLKRPVMEFSQNEGKQVELSLSGAETEIDRAIVETLYSPLIHLIRNSISHGIENREERILKGKNLKGKIEINAFYDSESTIIEYRDDGAGLNRKKIIYLALEKKLISEEETDLLQDRDLLRLIMTPGFSTSETLDNVSGRGIGMDIIGQLMEKFGGKIEICEKRKIGFNLKLIFPMNISVLSGFVFQIKESFYCVPRTQIIEIIRVFSKEIKLEEIGGYFYCDYRGELIQLLDFECFIDFYQGENTNKGFYDSQRYYKIMVVKCSEGFFGIYAGNEYLYMDLLFRPLCSVIRETHLYNGIGISSDGKLILCLDTEEIYIREKRFISGFFHNKEEEISEAVVETVNCIIAITLKGKKIALDYSVVERLFRVKNQECEFYKKKFYFDKENRSDLILDYVEGNLQLFYSDFLEKGICIRFRENILGKSCFFVTNVSDMVELSIDQNEVHLIEYQNKRIPFLSRDAIIKEMEDFL